MKRILAIIYLVISTLTVWAQSAQTVQIDFEKKIIYADSLTLPKSINVGALLRLLPELLQRPNDNVLSHYEVQIEEIPMGEASDVVLSVIQLADIERIEVKNSPTSTDLNNGQSGSINVCLRPLAAKRLGLSGTASLSVSSELSLMPNLLIDYHGEKFSVRGMAFGEIFNKQTHMTQTGATPAEMNNEERYREQLARAMLCYTPNSRNRFTLTLTEGSCKDKEMQDFSTQSSSLSDMNYNITINQHTTQLMSHLEYSHSFNATRGLVAKAQYGHLPSDMDYWEKTKGRLTDDHTITNNWQGSMEYFDAVKLAQGKGLLKYKFGAASSLSHIDTKNEVASRSTLETTTTENEVSNVMPFVELTMLYGPIRMKVGAEYQWTNEQKDRDWTGRMVIDWRMNRANRLRMILNRQRRRPLMLSREAGIDYIGDYRWGEHKLTTNAGLNYGLSTGQYIDKTHYSDLNLMAIYQYDIFFLSVTGNHYRKEQQHEQGVHKYYSYYNFSVMPSLNFRSGWRTAMNLRYYSRIKTEDAEESHCMTLQLNIGKSWKEWNAYVYGRMPVTGKTEFNEKNDVLSYHLVPASVGCGITWRGDFF